MSSTLTRWTFVRHGQSTANAGGWIAGHTDAPLSDLGRIQALAARAQIDEVPYERVLCSDLSRAIDTARLLTAGPGRVIPMTIDAALRERACGEWEGLSLATLSESSALDVLHTFDERPPAGESLRDVAVRVLEFLGGQAAGGHALVVCHGALMRAVIGVLDGTDPTQVGVWKPDNCEAVTRAADARQLTSLAASLKADAPRRG